LNSTIILVEAFVFDLATISEYSNKGFT